METKISSNLPPWRPKVHKGTFLRIAFLSILFQILLERLPHTYYRSFFLVGSTPTKWRVPVSCKLDGNSVADPGEGPGGPAPLISRLNWGSKGRKLFLETPPPPRLYLRVWMTAPSPYLKVWIRHGTGNIALLISVMFPPCGDMLIYFSMYATRFRSVMFSHRKRTIKFPSHFCYYISVLSSFKSFHGLAPNFSYNLRGEDSLSSQSSID